MKTYNFDNGVVFNVYHENQYCETILPNGKLVPAVPEEGDDIFAKDCGYGDRIWDLNWQHEFIHNWLASERDQECSPVLKFVSEGGKEPSDWSIAEETDVINIQRKLNGQDVQTVVSEDQLERLKNILGELHER